MVSNRNTIVDALATERRLTLCSICAHHRVMWVANEIERAQIREYAETLLRPHAWVEHRPYL
jgi:hypothetical protein